jgi:protein SCO1/2
MRKSTFAATALAGGAALAVCGAFTLVACTSGSGGEDVKPAIEISGGNSKPGTVLDHPKDKPELVLTDSKGRKYDLLKETRGTPTLLFFGYTHCPDVCPTTMSDLALAKRELPRAEQDKLRVVFVTTDPERDTPEQLGKWLGAQDKDFIGLTGDINTITAAARTVGVHIDKPVKEKDGSVTVSHGSEVLAFSPKDDKAHVIYLAGVTAEEYAKDLPALIDGRNP